MYSCKSSSNIAHILNLHFFLQFITSVIYLTLMYSYIQICPTYSLTMCHIADYALVSLCNIVMMEDAWELALVNIKLDI